MADSSGDPALDFDMLSAAIRADAADLKTFMEALAVKLGEALPGHVAVEREGGLFQKEHRVRKVSVDLDDRHYELERLNTGVEARTAHQVRGIRLKTDVVGLDAWIEDLARRLAAHAQANAQARSALNRLIS
jgi:hypothetical protein